jgi:hypothetical protein
MEIVAVKIYLYYLKDKTDSYLRISNFDIIQINKVLINTTLDLR